MASRSGAVPRRRTYAPVLASVMFIAVAVARIVATYPVYSPTFDEPVHLAAGMDWLDRGVYHFDQMHPPLGRAVIALGPWLAGRRSHDRPGEWQEGNAILHSKEGPARGIALARTGTLPFFVLLVALSGIWAAMLAGPWAGACCVLLLTMLPPVLAHAGLATTDVPGAAGLIGALMAVVRWLERPSRRRGLVLGVAAGFALLCKMSAVAFLPVAGTALFALSLWNAEGATTFWRSGAWRRGPWRSSVLSAGITLLLVLWAGYRFSIGPLKTSPETAPVAAHADLISRSRAFAVHLAAQPIFPAAEWMRGVKAVMSVNGEGRKNFVLGAARRGGMWWFFPFALGIKTPLAFLALAAIGTGLVTRASRRARQWQAMAPLAAAIAILGVAMAGNINIGVRHVLAIYPLMCIYGAAAMVALWRVGRHRLAALATVAVLCGWLTVESIRAHPDYLPYFNQLAGAHPERMLVDSDLDWGQDLNRLSDTLRARKVDRVALAYHGKLNLSDYGLPPFTELEERTPTTGWVAISYYRLELGYMGGEFDSFAWLRPYRPVARVGRSILLYHIEDPGRPQG